MNPTAEALHQRSFNFSVKIVAFARLLSKTQTDRVLATQVLRSGTSIGANIREAQFAQSKADFVSKLSIALKEASETQYWLELLFASGLMSEEQRDLLKADTDWLVGTLVNVVKATKRNLKPSQAAIYPFQAAKRHLPISSREAAI